MNQIKALLLASLTLPLATTPVAAQMAPALTGTSKPQPVAPADTIPPAADTPYPGTIQLSVDATDVAHGVFRIDERIPVAASGPLVLLYPKWLPGGHAPQGEIDKVAGLTIRAGGKVIPWTRDPVDITAFHIDVLQGAAAIDVSFQFLSATKDDQGTRLTSPDLLGLEWISMVLYPAGYYTRQITVDPSITYPAGWTAAGALRPVSGTNADARTGPVRYKPVALDTLADSPMYAGRYVRREALSPDVTLNMIADRPDALAITPAQLATHRELVRQATSLFGAQHYDHYDFLLALTDRTLDHMGLEHHRSSEDQATADSFTNYDADVASRDLLAHEYTHSWNGKFRRGADLWTPDYRYPMRNSLLWVYEGQTQFWGKILTARAGMIPQADAYDALAANAAYYDSQPGRAWRSLVDTTNEEIISNRHPEPYTSQQRAEDYYNEGWLIWLDADSLIRQQSGGKRSLDDFARAFFGVRDRDWGELTYTFDDVVQTLNAVQPYDWATFLHDRVYAVAPQAPLTGITRGGYRLVYTETPGHFWTAREAARKITDLRYSLGLVVGEGGEVNEVVWDGPAFKAGISTGTTLMAVDGSEYDADLLKAAIQRSKGGSTPIQLLIKQGKMLRTVAVTWSGGLRYPHLERTGKGPSTLDALYAPRR